MPPALLREGGLKTFEANLRRSLNDAEARSAEVGAHQVMIGILPTLAPGHFAPQTMSANPRYRLLSEQILHARGEDIRIDITGPGAADHDCRLDPARGRVHQHPVPRADLARAVRGVLERLAGDRVGAARGRRQLAVLPGQGAVARDPDPPVRAGRGHPERGAEGAGRAPAGVVRRALDQLGLRPVRGERPLLPGAAADHRRRGPGRGPRVGRHAPARRAAAAQRHDLPLEPAGLRHQRRHAPPAGGEPRAAGGSDRGRPDRERRVLLRAGPPPRGERPAAVVADVVPGRRGELRDGGRGRHRRRDLLARASAR